MNTDNKGGTQRRDARVLGIVRESATYFGSDLRDLVRRRRRHIPQVSASIK